MTPTPAAQNAAAAIVAAGGPVAYLRNAQALPTQFPVRPEFTNWISEQRSWRESVALLDQSHHMSDLFIRGADAARLLSDTGVNSFAKFPANAAKQFIAVNHEGYLIGDAILFHLEGEAGADDDVYDLVGWHMVLDWVQYHGETGGYDVRFERDPNSIARAAAGGGDPTLYRYELQGPNALALLKTVTGRPVPETRFFGMETFEIAGVTVRSLRHGMAGMPGFELFGPWADGERVRAALVDAGEAFGLTLVGSRAYSSANLESAWVPSPLPAIYTGEGSEAYLEWLPAARLGSLAGSFDAERIEDYYLTPYELGYGRTVKFDHEFIGREALERRAAAGEPERVKVSLVWEPEDVAAIQRSAYEAGTPAKFLEFPKARYGQHQVDRVLVEEETIGLSHDVGYSVNEQAFLSLASLDPAHAEPGTEVEVVWGEEPNTAKPAVERHRQLRVRATVAPAPYSRFARENYRAS
ncbi:aminomethyl transferase family protein [Leucobacter allii]|uniref:aminomethyl transferase family protein n=1 Tax=Leucobacter allii TaxID=2932247 RepID=UPI001FCF8DA1|nr:aminomethyl transferase family protein [Leucobacter allii]UOR01826.1 aminomethyl transferase family protein [Leucobacter allii]